MTAFDDDRLIAAMLEPPPLEQARDSLAFWERRRSALPVYRRGARREADAMIRRCREQVAAAERHRYGAGLAGLVRRLLAHDVAWPGARVALLPFLVALVPRRLVLVLAGVATAWLLTVALVVVAIVA